MTPILMQEVHFADVEEPGKLSKHQSWHWHETVAGS